MFVFSKGSHHLYNTVFEPALLFQSVDFCNFVIKGLVLEKSDFKFIAIPIK